MKFDLQTSLGILSVVSALTCAGCTKESENTKVQVDTTKEATRNVEKHSDLVFSPKGSESTKSKSGHTAHSAHISHASHSSSRY